MGVQLLNNGVPTAAVLGVTFGSLAIVVAVVVIFLMQRNKKKEMRKIARFLGKKTESQMFTKKDKYGKHDSSDDESHSSQGSKNGLDQFKGVKAMIKKKDENIEDAQFKINSLEKELNEEKARRERLMEKREQLARISGSATREDKEKIIAELNVDIKKKEEAMDKTLYRITSLNEFVKSQESVREGLLKQKEEMVEINVQRVDHMVDQMSDLNDKDKDAQDDEVVVFRDSEHGSLRRRNQNDPPTDIIPSFSDN